MAVQMLRNVVPQNPTTLAPDVAISYVSFQSHLGSSSSRIDIQ